VNTIPWLQNCIGGCDALYYARLRMMLYQIIIDGAMYAQYPVWEHTMTTIDLAGNQVDFSPISNLICFRNEPATNHRTYTMSNTVYNLGIITVAGAPAQVTFLLQPPSYKEWFKAGYNIAANNDELDSWINGYTLALLLSFERNTLQALPRNLYFRNSLLDFDLINIPHCVPRHRAAQAFNNIQAHHPSATERQGPADLPDLTEHQCPALCSPLPELCVFGLSRPLQCHERQAAQCSPLMRIESLYINKHIRSDCFSRWIRFNVPFVVFPNINSNVNVVCETYSQIERDN
jgi:hypothetical protein